MKKYTNKKKKIIIGMSLGVVVAASAISVAVVTTSHHNSTPSINENEISVNFKTENNKVHLNKLVSEPVGYANSNLQLEVHDANGNVVKDATFTATNLPEGINFSKTGILNGVAKKDGIFYANIVANSPSLNASKTLNVEIDVPKPLEVKVHNASFVDVIGSQGDTFTIATNDPSDKYQIISGVLPSGIIFNNDTGVFSGTPATSGTFHLTVHVTNPNSEYSYSNIQVNLQVETAIEALIAGAENISQALKNNVNKFNDLLASLGNTWNVGKDIYSKSTDIVNDVSAIVGKTQNAYNEIVNLFNEASKVFAGDWWKNASDAATSKIELTIEQYSDKYFLPIASVVDGMVNTIDSLRDSLGSILSLIGVDFPDFKSTYQEIINIGARLLTGDKVYFSEFTGLLDLLENKINEVRNVLDTIVSYVPSDAQIQTWQKEISELEAQRDQCPAFVDSKGGIADGSKTDGTIIKTTVEWRNVTYKVENGQIVITGGEAKHSIITFGQWISLADSNFIKANCDKNGHIEIKLFDFVTIFSFDAPANPERFAIQKKIDEIQAKIDGTSITSKLLSNEIEDQIAYISGIVDTLDDTIVKYKGMLPNTLEYMTKIGIDGFKLPWAILENKKASELTSLTDIANALHEDYLFNLNRWNTFVDSLTGLYNDGKKTITDIEQIVSDLQNLIVKIQTDISEAQTELTSAISDNIKQLNEFIEASKATIESIKTVIGIASHII